MFINQQRCTCIYRFATHAKYFVFFSTKSLYPIQNFAQRERERERERAKPRLQVYVIMQPRFFKKNYPEQAITHLGSMPPSINKKEKTERERER